MRSWALWPRYESQAQRHFASSPNFANGRIIGAKAGVEGLREESAIWGRCVANGFFENGAPT